MFVIGLQGSPRAKGNTSSLLSAFLGEVERLGGRVGALDVTRKKNIMPCMECGTCETKGYCPLDDDMQSIYPLLRKADLVVMATPIFFYGPTAQIKAVIDRSQALWSRKYALGLEDPGRKWRKGFLLAVGATKGKNLFDGTNLTARYFFDAVGASFDGTLGYRHLEKAGDIEKHPKALAEARTKAGELVTPFLNRKKLLFVCRENACRSQMGAAFARRMAGDRFEVESAGSAPAGEINPVMVEAMAEKGIDMAYLKPGSMTDPSDGRHPDMVVSMGCENVCPGFPGASVKEWNIPDPSGKTLDFMQNVRDQVERKVDDLISEYGQ